MTSRIDSIYYFNYTKQIGYCDSIRDFSSVEMTYIGLAISTPEIRVNSSPNKFVVSEDGSNNVRKYTISQINMLQEICEELAVNSPKYILINYFDGTKRYFEYNEEFCNLFKIVLQYQPRKEMKETYENQIFLQSSSSIHTPTSVNTSQQSSKPLSNSALSETMLQKNTASSSVLIPKKKTFPWARLIIGVVTLCIIFIIPIIAIINDAMADSDLTPVSEPRSGTILSGRAVYDGSEITVTAPYNESCVVKLKTRSGFERVSFYVRAGETVTVGVPAENLYVYFASGGTWYGVTLLFGEKTSYSMDDDLCDFTTGTWKYTLYPVTNGNFQQTPIDASEFN